VRVSELEARVKQLEETVDSLVRLVVGNEEETDEPQYVGLESQHEAMVARIKSRRAQP
jgi:hypothetical protein